jgi:hypothetical protein
MSRRKGEPPRPDPRRRRGDRVRRCRRGPLRERGSDIPSLEEVAAPVTVDGDPISVPYPEDGPDPAVGLPSPVITALDYDDRRSPSARPVRRRCSCSSRTGARSATRSFRRCATSSRPDGVPDSVDLVFVTTGLDPGRPNWPPHPVARRRRTLAGVTTVRDDLGDPADACLRAARLSGLGRDRRRRQHRGASPGTAAGRGGRATPRPRGALRLSTAELLSTAEPRSAPLEAR